MEPKSLAVREDPEPPTIVELNREENKVRIEEEMEVEQKRRAAQQAAVQQGLVKEEPVSLDGVADVEGSVPAEEASELEEAEEPVLAAPRPPSIPSRRSSGSGPEPFPDFTNDDEPARQEPP